MGIIRFTLGTHRAYKSLAAHLPASVSLVGMAEAIPARTAFSHRNCTLGDHLPGLRHPVDNP